MKQSRSEKLEEIFDLTLTAMLDKVREGGLKASDLEVIRKFLNDNDIKADSGSLEEFKELKRELPKVSELDRDTFYN